MVDIRVAITTAVKNLAKYIEESDFIIKQYKNDMK